MKPHTKLYLEAIGYNLTDFVPSEISGKKAVDIHHIIGRGRGGKDRIENLMALTREEHLKYGDKNKYIAFLIGKHKQFLDFVGAKYSESYFNEILEKYENRN